MLYLATSPCEPAVADLLSRRRIGLMCQPASNPPKAGWLWAADNGCFSEKWNEAKWMDWLVKEHPRSGCLFAVVPDVVADAEATRTRWDRYAPIPSEQGYPLAYVAQDGEVSPPWSELDALFIGGSTEWKMGEAAFKFATVARENGKWVHVGRVNSWSRYRTWAQYADSCDGTFLAFGPKTNTPRLLRWLDRHDESPQFEFAGLRGSEDTE